jgi:hypothetical protein
MGRVIDLNKKHLTLALIAKFKKIMFPAESGSNGKRGDGMNSSDKKETEHKPTLKEAGYEFKDGQLRLVNMQAALEASGLLGSRLYPKDAKYPGSELELPSL